MPINYAALRATAKRLIGENGVTYVITRNGALERVGGVETRKPAATFDCVGIVTNWDPREINGKTIQTGDLKLICVPEQPLAVGDLVEYGGTKYRVEHPNPVKPGLIVLVYKAVLRAA